MSLDIQKLPTSSPSEQGSPAPQPSRSTPPSPPKSSAWKYILAVMLVGGIALGAAALASRGGPQKLGNVLTQPVSRGDLVVSVTEQGTLESSSNTEIKCRVKGGSTVLWVIETGTQVQPGEVLVRLDQSSIEDTISQQKIAYETALSNKATSETDVAVAKIGITEYLDGTFRSEQTTKQKDVVIAQSNLKSAKNALAHAEKMFRKGYTSKLDLESQRDAVHHAELELQVAETDLDALQRFTKAKQLEELNGLLAVAKARLASDEASLELEQARLARAENQLENCVIVAETSGIVIHPSAAEWKETPDIEEGASVREDQVLLVIPDMEQMQVKVGIHESKVDRLRLGMPARVELQDSFADGSIKEIATITKGGGWWTGNMVKYDTIIQLDRTEGLKPGMSVSVEVFLAKHTNVLTVPVAAVVELDGQYFAWVQAAPDQQPAKRAIQVSDSNDTHIVVTDGLSEGEQVVLNPRDFVDEAVSDSLQSIQQRAAPEDVPEVKADSKGDKQDKKEDKGGDKPKKQQAAKPTAASVAAGAMEKYDTDKDGSLTIDEVKDENWKRDFDKHDANSDGKLTKAELVAALKPLFAGKSGRGK